MHHDFACTEPKESLINPNLYVIGTAISANFMQIRLGGNPILVIYPGYALVLILVYCSVLCRKMNVDPDVNYDELARCTDDFNGAQCKAVCVEAGTSELETKTCLKNKS